MRILFTLLMLLLAANGFSQAYTVFDEYDLDSTSYVYCDTTDIPTGMSACASGTAATDGWVTKGKAEALGVFMGISQIGVTGGIDFRIEGRFINDDATYTTAAVLWPADGGKNKTAGDGTDDEIQLVPDEVSQIRVGIKIGTNDDGNDLTTNLEEVTVVVNLYR